MLYTPTAPAAAGSAHGWMTATPDRLVQPENGGQPLLDGVIDWMKLRQADSSTTRSYKSGFPMHNLTVLGGRYVKPAGGAVLGLVDAGINNAAITLGEGGLRDAAITTGTDTEFTQGLRITSANAVLMPSPGATNPASVTLTLDATTGILTGAFTLKDLDPTAMTPVILTRSAVPYAGVLVPRLNKGVGSFQLQQLPASGPPKTTLTTSPQVSGWMMLLKP